MNCTHFSTEVDYNNIISIRCFTIAISKYINSMDHFTKIEISTHVFRYGIFLGNNNDYFQNHFRQSQRNRKGKITPHPLGKIVHAPTESSHLIQETHIDKIQEDAYGEPEQATILQNQK